MFQGIVSALVISKQSHHLWHKVYSLGMQNLLKGGSWDTFYMFPVSVDVRDVAAAHILAAEIPSANVSSHIQSISACVATFC
jgi:hypothetical protein